MKTLLLIDDDEKLGELLQEYFKQFDFDLLRATSPSEGIALLAKESPSALILDVMLPEKDGFQVCREIRGRTEPWSAIPILMLTARGEVTDRIVGLELGADDYLSKPFEPEDLYKKLVHYITGQ